MDDSREQQPCHEQNDLILNVRHTMVTQEIDTDYEVMKSPSLKVTHAWLPYQGEMFKFLCNNNPQAVKVKLPDNRPDRWATLLAVMALTPQHSFTVVASDRQQLKAYLADIDNAFPVHAIYARLGVKFGILISKYAAAIHWPPRNITFPKPD